MRTYTRRSCYVNYTRIGRNVVRFGHEGLVAVVRKGGGSGGPNLGFEFDVLNLPVDENGVPVNLIYELEADRILQMLNAPREASQFGASFLLGELLKSGNFAVSLTGVRDSAIFLASGFVPLDQAEVIQFYEELAQKESKLYFAKAKKEKSREVQYFLVFKKEELFAAEYGFRVGSIYLLALEKAYRGYVLSDEIRAELNVMRAFYNGMIATFLDGDAVLKEDDLEQSDVGELEKIATKMSFKERYELFRDEIESLSGNITFVGNYDKVKATVILPNMDTNTYGSNETDFRRFLCRLDECRCLNETDAGIVAENLRRVVKKLASGDSMGPSS